MKFTQLLTIAAAVSSVEAHRLNSKLNAEAQLEQMEQIANQMDYMERQMAKMQFDWGNLMNQAKGILGIWNQKLLFII